MSTHKKARRSRGWNDLSEQAQDDLRKWFNVDKTTDDEMAMLAALYFAGRFHAWDCPWCGDRVYWGNPEFWDRFQGSLQADYASYPGNPEMTVRYRSQQCDRCRMHDTNTTGDLNLIGIGEPSCWASED